MHSTHNHGDAAAAGDGSEPGDAPYAEAEAVQADPLADARLLLAEHEQERRQACATEIAEVLARYGYNLHVPPAQIMLAPRS